MTHPSDTTTSTGIQHRRPREGERTRGAVDALQTKITVGLQNLDPLRYTEQLQANIDELPEATGADAAFLALISADGDNIEAVSSSCEGFAQCSPGVLQGEKLADWPWLCKRLGHLRVIEVADTVNGPKSAESELGRFNEIHIGSALIIGFCVHGEIAGFLGLANERAVESWDADLHLLMKLFGSSLAVGLERSGILTAIPSALICRDAGKPCWVMAPTTRMSCSTGIVSCIRMTSHACKL